MEPLLALFPCTDDLFGMIIEGDIYHEAPISYAAHSSTESARFFSPGNMDPRLPRFLHVAPNFPTTDWSTDFGLPWWRDPKRVIGKVRILPLP